MVSDALPVKPPQLSYPAAATGRRSATCDHCELIAQGSAIQRYASERMLDGALTMRTMSRQIIRSRLCRPDIQLERERLIFAVEEKCSYFSPCVNIADGAAGLRFKDHFHVYIEGRLVEIDT
jgi:hypothetical protein